MRMSSLTCYSSYTDPLDEVELIAPKRTTADVDGVIDEGDFGGFPGIIVVQRRRNPFFNPFDELFGRPDVGVNQGGVISGGEQDDDGTIVVEESLPGGLGSFFGPVFASAGSDGGEADIDEEGEVARCGLICSIFKYCSMKTLVEFKLQSRVFQTFQTSRSKTSGSPGGDRRDQSEATRKGE